MVHGYKQKKKTVALHWQCHQFRRHEKIKRQKHNEKIGWTNSVLCAIIFESSDQKNHQMQLLIC